MSPTERSLVYHSALEGDAALRFALVLHERAREAARLARKLPAAWTKAKRREAQRASEAAKKAIREARSLNSTQRPSVSLLGGSEGVAGFVSSPTILTGGAPESQGGAPPVRAGGGV